MHAYIHAPLVSTGNHCTPTTNHTGAHQLRSQRVLQSGREVRGVGLRGPDCAHKCGVRRVAGAGSQGVCVCVACCVVLCCVRRYEVVRVSVRFDCCALGINE